MSTNHVEFRLRPHHERNEKVVEVRFGKEIIATITAGNDGGLCVSVLSPHQLVATLPEHPEASISQRGFPINSIDIDIRKQSH